MKQRICQNLTYGQANRLLRYDPITGNIYWKKRPLRLFNEGCAYTRWNEKYAGELAFTCKDKNGYRRGGILGKVYLAHRVIWLLLHKRWPERAIKHLNGENSDNRRCNLREGRLSPHARKSRRPYRRPLGQDTIEGIAA